MARDAWRMGRGVVACFGFDSCFFGACLSCLGAARFTCCDAATVSQSVTDDTDFLTISSTWWSSGKASGCATSFAAVSIARYLLGCLLERLGWRLGGCLLQLRSSR